MNTIKRPPATPEEIAEESRDILFSLAALIAIITLLWWLA